MYMSTSNSKHGIFLFKYNENTYPKGEHSYKCIDLSLKQKRCKRCISTKMIKRHIVLVKVSKVDKTGRTTACVKGCTYTK